MQICTLTQTHNHASIPPLSFLQAGCPSCHPASCVKALNLYQHCCCIRTIGVLIWIFINYSGTISAWVQWTDWGIFCWCISAPLYTIDIFFQCFYTLVEWQEGHPSGKTPVPLVLKGSFPEQVEDENQWGNWLTQIHLETCCRGGGILQWHSLDGTFTWV